MIFDIYLSYNSAMKTKKWGRPLGSTGKAKGKLLQVRVDELEQLGFAKAAELAGIGLSAWARERLRIVCRRELEQNGQQVPFLSGK